MSRVRRILEQRVTDPDRFTITPNTPGQPLGEGRNEKTQWTFDFTQLPNIKEFFLEEEGGLDVARLELCLTPGDKWISNDSVQIEGLGPIHLSHTGMLPHLKLDKPVCCNLDLLEFYGGGEILGVLETNGYQLPMLYQEDAEIHDAYLRLEQWHGSTEDWRARLRVIVHDTRASAHFAWCLGFEE